MGIGCGLMPVSGYRFLVHWLFPEKSQEPNPNKQRNHNCQNSNLHVYSLEIVIWVFIGSCFLVHWFFLEETPLCRNFSSAVLSSSLWLGCSFIFFDSSSCCKQQNSSAKLKVFAEPDHFVSCLETAAEHSFKEITIINTQILIGYHMYVPDIG